MTNYNEPGTNYNEPGLGYNGAASAGVDLAGKAAAAGSAKATLRVSKPLAGKAASAASAKATLQIIAKARVTQVYVEPLVHYGTAAARVTQTYVETLIQLAPPAARVTQTYVEVLIRLSEQGYWGIRNNVN